MLSWVMISMSTESLAGREKSTDGGQPARASAFLVGETFVHLVDQRAILGAHPPGTSGGLERELVQVLTIEAKFFEDHIDPRAPFVVVASVDGHSV